MTQRRSLVLVAFLAVAWPPVVASAEVTLTDAFGDHMVLQRDMQVPVFGAAAAGEVVTVTFRDQEHRVTTGPEGTWRVTLRPLAAGGPDDLRVAGTNTVTRRDVLVGEVWVGSGQSNMAGPVKAYLAKDEVLATLVAHGPYPRLRLFTSTGRPGHPGTWREASGHNVEQFSALMFAFGVALQKELDVPVGLMVGAVGGTPSGAWISRQALDADGASQTLMQAYAERHEALVAEAAHESADQKAARASLAAQEGRHPTNQPNPRPGTTNNQDIGHLYDSHIRPLVGYGIRGVLWDQGESGSGIGGVDQVTVMRALIAGWRAEWGQGDFPFLYVQKPSGGGCAWDTTDPTTSMARPFSRLPTKVPDAGRHVEEYIRLMKESGTAMVITSDLGPGLHPPNKSGYGHRAAHVALGMVYARQLEYYGPVYRSHEIQGDRVRVTFTHVGKGLAYRHGDRLQGFAIAGADRVFHWGDAEIDGDTVVVSSPHVPKPVALRYAWAGTPSWANLFNKDGLPALTFRTDDWDPNTP